MNKKIKISLVLGLILLFGSLIWFDISRANITSDPPTSAATYKTYTFFTPVSVSSFNTASATTTSATSTNINPFVATTTNYTVDNGYFVIAGAKKVDLYFQRGDISGQGNTGTSTFSIQTSPDGTNWYNFNRLIIASSTVFLANQTTTGNVILSASADYNTGTSTIISSMELTNISPYAIRCIVAEGANGEHSCK